MSRKVFAILYVLPLLLIAPQAAFAATAVRFKPVETVSNLDFRSVSERDLIFRELARYLERLGDRQLGPRAALTVDLLDVKPAGRVSPFHPEGPRVLSDVTPPRITLRYALVEGGRTVAREETLTDLNYLWNVSARSSLASYPYEKELLRDWLQKRLVDRKPALN